MPLITNMKSDFRLRVSFPVLRNFPVSFIIALFDRVLDFLRFSFGPYRDREGSKPISVSFGHGLLFPTIVTGCSQDSVSGTNHFSWNQPKFKEIGNYFRFLVVNFILSYLLGFSYPLVSLLGLSSQNLNLIT